MSTPASDSNNSSSDLPEITFADPTDDESDQIEFLLFDEGEVTGKDLQSLFSHDDEFPIVNEEIKSLFVHNSPPDSIADYARITAPNVKNSSAVNGNDYASFGNEGTTVTVNSYGNIMQITRSLGYGHSGLFCVDTNDVCGPTSPQSRLENLMQLARSPEGGIGLKAISGSEDRGIFAQQKPKMEFVFNRWPRFTSEQIISPSESVPTRDCNQGDKTTHRGPSLQYFCHKGTVFQKYIFDDDAGPPSAVQNGILCIRQNLLIRTLDFVNESKFNHAKEYDDSYVLLSGPKKHSHILAHRMTESEAKQIGITEEEYRKDDGPKAIALIITVFVNGKAQALASGYSYLYIRLSEEAQKDLKESKRNEVTISYRLQVLKAHQSWKQSFIPASDLGSMGAVFAERSDISFQSLRWSFHEHTNFIVGRHLEHILSVCSMPVPRHLNRIDEEEGMDTTSLAMTCGDLSGHRVANTATFFAFEFLIEILKYICEKSKEPRHYMLNPDDCDCLPYLRSWKCRECRKLDRYIHSLRVRILKTLEAYISWTAKAKKEADLDSHDFWITGMEIASGQPHRSCSSVKLTDTPFHVIKCHNLYDFYTTHKWVISTLSDAEKQQMNIMRDFPDHNVLEEHLATTIRSWWGQLYKNDKRGKYVFSRAQEDGVKKYHLADHVWIYRAIQCIEALGLERHLELQNGLPYLGYPQPGEEESKDQEEQQVSRKQEKTPPLAEMRRVALKRFTTRNPHSQQRMLATSRTPSETRFLFHARDTALFYAMDLGFFDQGSSPNNGRTNWANKIAVWLATVETQSEHEATQALDWEKPLWYTLAFIISSRRKRVNNISADEMLHTTANIIFGLSSPSGLFPGFLNRKREPISFENELERDKYWQATFEIPYALWMYGRPHLETSVNLTGSAVFRQGQSETGRVKDHNQPTPWMKKKMEFATFNNLIDKNRLVEVSDDWMREPPSFLMFDSTVELSIPDRDFGRVINNALNGWSVTFGSSYLLTGTVFDVPRRGANREPSQSTKDLSRSLLSNAGILEKLCLTRTVQNAKKRLIWLPKADKHTAFACYLTSPHMERDNLSAFFDRHASYEKHFFDGTSAALNEWSTELHLSYFRRADLYDTAEILQNRRNIIPDSSFILVDEKSAETSIVRSAMSFRFVGDFFDRYWTCHFVESSPTTERNEYIYDEVSTLQSRLSDLGFVGVRDTKVPGRTKRPWQQRKVLELLLFEYFLNEIYSRTKEVFDWVRTGIFKKDSTSTVNEITMASVLERPFAVRATLPLNPLAESLQAGVPSLLGDGSVGYFAMAERWRFFDKVLQAMEEDLSGNLETISLWNRREKDREPERPRWTREDEMTYRQVINKLQVMTQKRTRDLDDLKRAIRIFRDSFNGKLDTMRSDLEYQGSENTNIFTYVTVVFLPLGFATGIFSMSGTPDSLTLANMIEIALITMALTLFALSSAKTSGKKIVRPVIVVFNFISIQLLDPLLDLLLRPFHFLEAFLSFLGKILLLLRNFLLYVGLAARAIAVYGFYIFVALPMLSGLDSSHKLLGFTQGVTGHLKEAYDFITSASDGLEEEIEELNDVDILEFAKEHFQEREQDKEERRKAKLQKSRNDQLDLERGDPDPASSESEGMVVQPQG